MKFAVVEYTSKSGKIWRHQEGKPNYLADPEKEIDPTSFGSYVSALGGEHIPITGFITGDINKPNKVTVVFNKVYKRLTGSWPQTYSIKYMEKFDFILLVHQLSDAHEITAFGQRLKQTYPHIFIVGVPTQPYGLLRKKLDDDPKTTQELTDFIDACDVFLSVVKETKDYYANMSSTEVVYLPQIYPTHYASKQFLPWEKKDKSIFVAGITDRPDIAKGFLVAKQLQKEFPEYDIKVTQIPGVEMDFSNLEGATYSIAPFDPWREHLPWLAKQAMVINTDYTLTRGRVQVDAAAVGTPALGSNSDGQTDLFPELAATEDTSVETLVEMGRKLLSDHEYYAKTAQYGLERLKKYDFEESAARILLLVKSHQEGIDK